MITAFVADAATVNPNGIKTLSPNGLSTFPIKGDPIFSNGLKILPKNCPISCNWVFDCFLLAEELASKVV